MNRGLKHLLIIFLSLINKIGLALYVLGFCLYSLQLSAQQDPMFSQYMFNKLMVNPGYAGSAGTFNASLAYRRQFIGLEGAPQIQAISIDAPFKTKPMGFGIKAIHESIGVTSQNEVSAIYAYHLDLGEGKLSFGLEGGIFNQTIDFTNLRKTVQDDNAIPIGKESMLVPDAAFGLYYSSEKLYLGGAFYHLLQNELNYSGYTGSDRTLIARLSSHTYILGGYRFKPQENIRIEPSILIKYVASAPIQIDMNVNATFKDVFTIGATYRTKNAIVFLFQYSFKQRLKFGYAYDYIISELSSYGYSTHGIMLSYHIPSEKRALDVEEEDEETVPEILAAVGSLPEDSADISASPLTEDTAEVIEPTPAEILTIPDADDASDTPVITDEKDTSAKDPAKVTEPTDTEIPAVSLTDDTSTSATQVIAEEDRPEMDDKVSNEEKSNSQEEALIDIPIVELPDEQKVTFKIQLLVKRTPIFLSPYNFKGMENVEEYEEGGLYKYVVGLAYDYDYAKDVLLNQVRIQGFMDAFIVAYYEGKRISVKEAFELLEK